MPPAHRSEPYDADPPVPPRRAVLPLALLALLPAATCGSAYHLPPRATQKLTPEIRFTRAPQRIEVQFHDGLLTLEPADAVDCRLEIDLLADDADEVERLAARVGPQIEEGPDGTARLTVALPTGAELDAVRTTWRLRVPAQVAVAVRTRKGAVVARGATGTLEVDGGAGVVDVHMAGGTARLATVSGSLLLRGEYPAAELRSRQGRIDVVLPREQIPVDVDVASEEGNVYLVVHQGQKFDVQFAGQEDQVRCDPQVRIVWEQIVGHEGVDFLHGQLGDLQAASRGNIRIPGSRAAVHARQHPRTDG